MESTIQSNMKLLRGLTYLIAVTMLVIPTRIFAETELPKIKIAEVQTTGVNGETDQEFIELFNDSSAPVDVTDWKLQYASSSGVSWQTKAVFSGSVYPNGRMLITSTDYLVDTADGSFAPGLKMDAGHLRIVMPDPSDSAKVIEVDLLGWGAAQKAEASPAVYPPAGKSLTRKVINDRGSYYQDSDDNKSDFELTVPSPESHNEATVSEPVVSVEPVTEAIDEEIIEAPAEDIGIEQQLATEAYLQIQITELLPNPASPATDDNDEYVEIYNPNDLPVNLSGYSVETGNNFSYRYVLGNSEIAPGAYMSLFSRDTTLTLSNTLGIARIVDPNGRVLFITDGYEDAKDGQAWAYINGVWQWTINPTPNLQNILVLESIQGASAKKSQSTKKKATKKTVTKKATTKKAAKQKVTKPKKSTKKSSDNKDDAATLGMTDEGDSSGGFSPQTWMIAGVAIIAVGYLLYEYKDDIRNKFLQLRRNRKTRPGIRGTAQGWGGN